MKGTRMAKILLVEDNEMNRDMLSRRLSRRGFEVIVAVDGKQALELARSQSPDLIVMDMRLPDVTGWEVTRTLKSDDATRHVPVLALTAQAMRGEDEKRAQPYWTTSGSDYYCLTRSARCAG